MAWSTSEMEKDGQVSWLVRLYDKTINGVRDLGLPSEVDEGLLAVKLPTVREQAATMRYRDRLPPGRLTPNGVIEFVD